MSIPLAGKHGPSRFTNGLSNMDINHGPTYNYLLPDTITRMHEYKNDFDTYTAGDWTVTKTSAASTQALTAGDGGLLLLTNPANINFIQTSQLSIASFTPAAGKKLWAKIIFRLADVVNSHFIFGLISANTTPFSSIADGIYVKKAGGAKTFAFTVVKSGTATTVTGYGTMTNATNVHAGFYYDGKDKVRFYIDGKQMATLASTNLPTAVNLAPLFSFKSGTSAGTSASIDAILAAKEA